MQFYTVIEEVFIDISPRLHSFWINTLGLERYLRSCWFQAVFNISKEDLQYWNRLAISLFHFFLSRFPLYFEPRFHYQYTISLYPFSFPFSGGAHVTFVTEIITSGYLFADMMYFLFNKEISGLKIKLNNYELLGLMFVEPIYSYCYSSFFYTICFLSPKFAHFLERCMWYYLKHFRSVEEIVRYFQTDLHNPSRYTTIIRRTWAASYCSIKVSCFKSLDPYYFGPDF